MRILAITCILTTLALSTLYGADYYVSPTGDSGNTGLSTNSPWPLQYALHTAGVGSTVHLMDGLYSAEQFWITEGDARHVVAINKWKPIITGSTGTAPQFYIGPSDPGGMSQDGAIIDGICISNSSHTALGIHSVGATVRNCKITGSGWHGIDLSGASNKLSVVERNLVENSAHYGIYIGGSNSVIRNNVFRKNKLYGIHYYSGYPAHNQDGTHIYNNLVYGQSNDYSVVIDCLNRGGSGAKGTNYLYCNTLMGGLQLANGTIRITNNIIVQTNGLEPIETYDSPAPTVTADYNMSTVTLDYSGPHDVTAAVNLLNTNNGLFWLTSSNAARGAAYTSIYPPTNFFGVQQSSVSDIGFVQYADILALDARNLATTNFPDYWEQLTVTNPIAKTLTMQGSVRMRGRINLK